MNFIKPYPSFLLLLLFQFIILNEILAQTPIVPLATDCNSWLNIKAPGGGVRIGDLDIPGNHLTVEAMITRTALPLDTTSHGQGDIVSKQSDPNDANYLLRADRAEITTTNGYFRTAPVCKFESNKTYHIAMVYNGNTLKFYRNGFLLSEVPCSGNMITNNWITTIGEYAWQPGYYGTALIGYINEVRIWDVARTQDELRTYLNNPLPSPTTQTGLKAYYQFDDLQNKQGNASWNGSIVGDAAINATNPLCSFVQDSCTVICDEKIDFGFRQSLCNPSLVSFITDNVGIEKVRWDFGTAGISDSFTPTIDFGNTLQNIPIRLTSTFSDGCLAQVEKSILIGSGDGSPLQLLDTTVCKGVELKFTAPESISYCWNSSTGSTGLGLREQTIIADASQQIFINRIELGDNLIVNGDFQSGNELFSSDYLFSPTGGVPGNYTIGNNPKAWDGQINCDLPAPASGMMLVNGEMITGTTIWKYTKTISTGTDYIFGFSISNLKTGNPRIHVYINGAKIDQVEFGNGALCTWQEYQLFWNSGSSDQIEIKLVTGLLPTGSNVFALDNIMLSEYNLFSEYIHVNVDEAPFINAISDVEICSGQKKLLSVETDAPASIQWYPDTNISNSNSLTPEVSPGVTTTYYVSTESAPGCKVIDSVQVSVKPIPEFTLSESEIDLCEGMETTIRATGGTTYEWYNAADFISDNAVLSLDGTESGIFKVIIKDELCNISDTLTSIVTIKPLPQISIEKSNDIDCKQTVATLEVIGAARLEWLPESSIIETGINYIRVAPGGSTMYYVKAFDTNGCYVTDSTLVNFSAINGGEDIKMPNAFSPNGDNKNECYGASNLDFLSGYQLVIWNRWGQQVYNSQKPGECWNGTLKGIRQPAGTYVYQLKGSSACGIVNKKGTIELIR
ncbi:gliding motility-associated C-terminal domain-containing protein [Flavihumibacter sp. ZG627]|uniref:T9SS type B sorting domain-containing protein n=1 Tax=Flavihumibacter sp. ZG627 TaxID=1463156 RepID=UPI002110E1BF|nr:gliding motility-associated C-terminal domain-containing protein [Flavihumibacter sp. ZG627]